MPTTAAAAKRRSPPRACCPHADGGTATMLSWLVNMAGRRRARSRARPCSRPNKHEHEGDDAPVGGQTKLSLSAARPYLKPTFCRDAKYAKPTAMRTGRRQKLGRAL